jgi:hypothetical protein
MGTDVLIAIRRSRLNNVVVDDILPSVPDDDEEHNDEEDDDKKRVRPMSVENEEDDDKKRVRWDTHSLTSMTLLLHTVCSKYSFLEYLQVDQGISIKRNAAWLSSFSQCRGLCSTSLHSSVAWKGTRQPAMERNGIIRACLCNSSSLACSSSTSQT